MSPRDARLAARYAAERARWRSPPDPYTLAACVPIVLEQPGVVRADYPDGRALLFRPGRVDLIDRDGSLSEVR